VFFPEGIAHDGNRFNRTAATAPLFNYLAPSESADEKMVIREGIEPSNRQRSPRRVKRTRGSHSSPAATGICGWHATWTLGFERAVQQWLTAMQDSHDTP
jgi:hypothetical protein